MRKSLLALSLCMPIAALAAGGVNPDGINDADLGGLPDYCTVKMKQPGTPQDLAARARFGPENWIHMHHYCNALNQVGRSRRASKPDQIRYYLGRAAGEYEYVSKGFQPDFWMRPQLYVEYADVLARLKDSAKAVHLLQEAIRLQPEYQAAYLPLIRLFREMDLKDAALQTATGGLRQFPNSAPLQKAYLELGGQRPFPEPLRKAAQERDSVLSKEMPGVDDGSRASAESAESMTASPGSEVSQEPVVDRGCRFCPPEEIQKKWRDSFGEQRKQ